MSEEIYDDDGFPHASFDDDIHGVPYMAPTCGQDGEWWPCVEAKSQGWHYNSFGHPCPPNCGVTHG